MPRPSNPRQTPSPSSNESVVLRLRLIGQMEAWTLNSETVLPAGRKTRALLAIAALEGPRPVLRSRLAELLWSRRPDEQARASLRQEIHRLLDVMKPVGCEVLTVTRDHIALRPGIAWIDVEEVLRATTANPRSLSLLEGDLLEDLDGADPAFDTWLATEREKLRDHARGVAEAVLRQQLDPEAAIPAAEQLLLIDRVHEGAWRTLMRAHAERGERGRAIEFYERCRAVLADLLDATPSPETQRLLAEIRAGRSPSLAASNAEDVPKGLPKPRVPTQRGGAKLGVLPLQLVGEVRESDAYLAPGLAEEITTALARFRWMFLVSSASLEHFASQTREGAAFRRTFGLDFLLDGTIQRVGNVLRVTLRLADLRDGNQIAWARRFDRQANDILSLQDEIAAEVVAQIDPEILLIESRRAAHRAPGDANAYDLTLRALPLISRLERTAFLQAADFLREAIELEPDFAAAHAWYAYWHIFLVGQGWAETPSAAMEQAGRSAERAITIDPQDARALTIAGHVRAFLHHRLRDGLMLHDRALSHNPNLAMAWALSAMCLSYTGDIEEGVRRFERYKRLSPMDPHAYFFDAGAIMLELLRRNFAGAVATGRQVSELNPSFSAGHKHYLAALGHYGDKEEALLVRRRLLAMEPGYTVQTFLERNPFQRPQDRELYAEGLRLAGVPEGRNSEAA